MNCKDCRYWQNDGHFGACKRYPLPQTKAGGDWCGEFKQMSIPLPVVTEEELKKFAPAITVDEVGAMTKAETKRGRPAKDKS